MNVATRDFKCSHPTNKKMVNYEGCVNLTVWQTFHNIPVHQIITLYTYTMLSILLNKAGEKVSSEISGETRVLFL